MIDTLEFDCSAWNIIKLDKNKSLLVGVVYRSPNSTEKNNLNLLSLIRAVLATKCQYVDICGNFNLPLIDWSINCSLEAEGSFSSEFAALVEELTLFQHVKSNQGIASHP